MRFFSWLRSKFQRKTDAQIHPKKGYTVMGDRSIADDIAHDKCPDCKQTHWIPGPSGGMSRNFECGDCGSRFNIALFGDGDEIELIFCERIGRNPDRPAAGAA